MDFLNVELARTGSYTGKTGPVTLTEQDLDDMVLTYTELKDKVHIPVKLGHSQDQKLLTESGLPAAGWVENLRRVGDRLVADLMRVPDEIGKLIRSGAFRSRSIEAIRNLNLAGQRRKITLTGLALLGTEIPAVDSLEDITKLYASGEVLAASNLVDSEASVMVIRDGSISKAVDEYLTRTEQSKEDDMDIGKLRAMLSLPETATEDDVLASLGEKLSAKPNNEGEKKTESAPDPEITRLSKELSDATTRLIQLENERAKEGVTVKVDEAIKSRRFMPASRDSLIKLAMHDSAAFDDLVKGTPENSVLGPEKGSSTSEGIPTEAEPTESELKVAAQMGLDKDTIVQFKAREAGVELPTKTKA